MGRLVEVAKVFFEKRAKSPGKAVIIQSKASSVERTTELYHSPGISSAPTKNDRAVEFDAGNARVIVATHNYRIEVEPREGETIIYSTDETGSTVRAKIILDNDGNIDLNGNSKNFVTYQELNMALQNFITALNLHTHPTAAVGSPSQPTIPMNIDISSAKTTMVRTG